MKNIMKMLLYASKGILHALSVYYIGVLRHNYKFLNMEIGFYNKIKNIL